MAKKWIASAIKKPGSLRRALGVKAGQKIPASELAATAKKPGKLGKRARLAQTLRSFHRSSYHGPLPYPSTLENVHGSEPKNPFSN